MISSMIGDGAQRLSLHDEFLLSQNLTKQFFSLIESVL